MLIAGDAFTTVKQDSLLSVITQREQISGPPPYLTTDWKAAEESVKRIRDFNARGYRSKTEGRFLHPSFSLFHTKKPPALSAR